jgi:hypothetical protein
VAGVKPRRRSRPKQKQTKPSQCRSASLQARCQAAKPLRTMHHTRSKPMILLYF